MRLFLHEKVFALEVSVEVAEIGMAHGAVEDLWYLVSSLSVISTVANLLCQGYSSFATFTSL